MSTKGKCMGIEVGPAVRNISAPVNRLGGTIPLGRVRAPVNEGPVAPRFLEKTMPLTLGKLNPEPKAPPQTIAVVNTELPSGAEAVHIAEQWLRVSKPRTIGVNKIEPIIYVAKQPVVLPSLPPETVAKPKSDAKIQPNTGQIEFSKVAPRGAILTELNTRSVQEQLVGQNLDEKPEISEREEGKELKLKDLLDEEVAEQRVYEISEAIDLAQAEANKEGVEEIDGPRILKFLRLHIGLISQIARKIRKDGSLDETLEELAARKFNSKNQAKAQTKELVAEKEPVRRGKEGKAVKEGAVERVFKYHFVKRSPVEEVVSRVVKKQQAHRASPYEAMQAVPNEVPEVEKRIEDYSGLVAETLKPAA